MAIPAVTMDGWLPAKAACVRAEVNIMSRCNSAVAVYHVRSVRLARASRSSGCGAGGCCGWLVAVPVRGGRSCSMSGAWPVMQVL